MNDGTRTHDDRNHNPGLYQLSYAHHKLFWHQKMARPRGLEPLTYGLAYHYSFHCFKSGVRVVTLVSLLNLWSGLYLHHLRWDTYSLYGSRRFPSLFYQRVRSFEQLWPKKITLATGFLGIANVYT